MKLNATSKIAIAALAVVGSFCALPAGRVRALPCPGGCQHATRFTFGMLGITTGQTARLNVVNALPVDPPSIPVGPPIRVTLMFVDGNGNPFNIAGAPLQTIVTLGPGQSGSLDLNSDAIPNGPPTVPNGPPIRVQIRALVAECEGCSRGFVVPTLEVFDNATGKSTLVIPDTPAINGSTED
ncbi:MAG TPA: hypothetical protein VKM94_01685 [Blastocatellia bacterium]|nr:hypothetical protein [Blastocatellia bacterium]